MTAGTLAVLAETAHLVAVKESMRSDDVAGRIQKLRDSVGRAFSIGLSADVQLLSTLPEADAWHTGLAALLPVDFVQVWRDAQSGNPQGPSLERLRRIAGALGAVPSAIGALHALAAILGTETVGPGGPFAHATKNDMEALNRSLEPVPDPSEVRTAN